MVSTPRALSPVVAEVLDRLGNELRARFGKRVAEIVLFGYRARGDAQEDSDVDVLVVIDDLSEQERLTILDLAFALTRASAEWVGLAPLVYSSEQAARMRSGGRRALLLTVGEEPRAHGGLTRLLQCDFVRAGRMQPEVAALFSRLMTFRQDADYTAEYVFTPAMAKQGLADAHAIIGAARAILVTDGWVALPGAPPV